MAVNVSTTASVCLYCKISSTSNTEKEFHEIYDEVGIELHLPTLVEKFFNIRTQNKGNQERLCDDCVNRLVELFDLEELAKEEAVRACNETLENAKTETKIVDEENLEKEISEENVKLKTSESYENCSTTNLKQDIANKSDDHEEDLNKDKSDLDSIENLVSKELEIQNIFKDDTVSDNDGVLNLKDHQDDLNKNEQNSNLDDIESTQSNNIENQNKLEYNVTIEDIQIKLNHQFSNQDKNIDYSEWEDIDSYEANNNKEYLHLSPNSEDIESCEDKSSDKNGNNSKTIIQNKSEEKVEIKEDSNTSAASETENNITYELFDIECLPNANDDDFNIFNEANEISNDDEEIQSNNENENDNEENLNENQEINETLLDSSTIDTESANTQDIIIEEILLEENEHKDLDLEKAADKDRKNEDDDDVENSNDVENECVNTDEIELDEIMVKDVNNIEDDTYSIEEEYLIEETACSQEYDCVDLNEYLEKVLVTKFQDLELDWKVKCKLCQESYTTFQDLIKHNCIKDLEEEQQFCCIIKDCKENFNDLNTLARHLILQHYDKLDSLTIYGKCCDCQKSFSNFLELNKHSCCRTIKRRTGSRNYCQYCDLDFQSLKRFVFHMQFHLTNHRPKICLLCGDLFNNSNDFFEHTQYKHNPDADMACIKCDRFFREKEVFDKHIELHEDAKYQYACIYCPKLYTNKYSLNKHMDIYHNNKSKALFCEYCEKEFVNNSSYRNHMKSHASDVQVETFICCSCGLLTNDDDCIRDHTETDSESPCYAAPIEEQIIGFGYSCENCSLDFHTPKQLKEHRLSSIHNDDVYYCGICRRSFNNLRQMRNHMGNHKDSPKWEEIFPITRYFVCNIGDCQESYPIWTSLYYHKKRPHKTAEEQGKPKDFKCQFCQQNCTSKMSLAVHVARSHNNSNILCPHCKQAYRSQKLLQEHIDKFHTPIKCDICLKDFKHRRNLESHNQLVHLNIKRYFCSVCQKGYFYKSEKDAHEKKVHPEFSFKCEICNFITNYPKSLEIHMDKHNNQQKFKCEVCSKTFGRKQLLNVHLKRHQNKKEYLCSSYAPECNCSASFYTYNQLKTHIQNKHPESKYITDNKRKKISKRTHIDLEEDDEDAYEMIYADDDDSIQVKRIKTSNESIPLDIYIEDDGEYHEDDNERTLQQEVELDEQNDDGDEYETTCS